MATLKVESFGVEGVNVDLNPLELKDSQLVHAQNCISIPFGGQSSICKRPGLVSFTLEETSGTVLGGINLPIQDLSAFGTHYIYIGRGAV